MRNCAIYLLTDKHIVWDTSEQHFCMKNTDIQVCSLVYFANQTCSLGLTVSAHEKKTTLEFQSVLRTALCVTCLVIWQRPSALQRLAKDTHLVASPALQPRGEKLSTHTSDHQRYSFSWDKGTPTCKNSLSSTCPFLFRSTSFRIS